MLTESRLINKALTKAFENEHVKHVMLSINSPGGSPVQAGRINDKIRELKARFPNKKVTAVIDDLCASGGYYIAIAADNIYADKASLVGSIGVISTSFGFDKLMSYVGVERRSFTAGEHKGFLDPYSPLEPTVRVFWEGVLATTHEQFKTVVKEGRKDKLDTNADLFSGLIWNGEQAIKLGLIDKLGGETALKKDIGIDNVIDYSPKANLSHILASKTKSEIMAIFSDLSKVKLQ